MRSFDEIKLRVLDEVCDLKREIKAVLTLLQKHWDSPEDDRSKHFGNVSHAFALLCFAKIDELSIYLWGVKERKCGACGKKMEGQSPRMRDFMMTYLPEIADPDREEIINVALQMWRHTPAHTAQPRMILCNRSKQAYKWALNWSQDADRSTHFRFQTGLTPPIPDELPAKIKTKLTNGNDSLIREAVKEVEDVFGKDKCNGHPPRTLRS